MIRIRDRSNRHVDKNMSVLRALSPCFHFAYRSGICVLTRTFTLRTSISDFLINKLPTHQNTHIHTHTYTYILFYNSLHVDVYDWLRLTLTYTRYIIDQRKILKVKSDKEHRWEIRINYVCKVTAPWRDSCYSRDTALKGLTEIAKRVSLINRDAFSCVIILILVWLT